MRFRNLGEMAPRTFRSHSGYHGDDGFLGPGLIRLPQHRLEQQWVLGEPLVGLGQHVAQLQPLALLVLLRPLWERGGAQF